MKLPKGIRQRGDRFAITASHTVDGETRRLYATRDTLDEAIQEQARLKLQLVAGLDQSPTVPACGAAWTLQKARDVTIQTRWKGRGGERKQTINADKAVEFFGKDTLMTAIDTEWIDQWIDQLIGLGNSDSTINRKLSALSTMFTVAMERPRTSGVTVKPKIRKRKECEGRLRYLSLEEEQQIVSLLQSWGKVDCLDGFQVLVDTGMRPNEGWQIRGEWVDLHLRRVTLPAEVTKTSRGRTIPLTDRAFGILEARVGVYGNGRLFPGMSDAVFRNQWLRVKAAMHLTQDKTFVPYITRHTCASRLVQNGVPLQVVKEWLGHKTIQMTLRYAMLDTSNLAIGVEALQNARLQQGAGR